MRNLLRADLWRFFNVNRLRGQFWGYALTAIGIPTLLFTVVMTAAKGSFVSISPAPITTVLSLNGGLGNLYLLLCGGVTAECLLGDLEAGFAKTVVAGTRGRLAYFAEKLLLCLVLCTVMMLVLAASVALFFLLFGITIVSEPVLPLLAWLGLTWLLGYAISLLSAAVVWLTHSSAVSYIGAILISLGVGRGLLLGLAASSGGILRVFQPIAPVLVEMANWMPGAAAGLLGQGIGVFGAPAISSLALPFGAGIQAIVICAGWAVVASALCLAIARKRDVA